MTWVTAPRVATLPAPSPRRRFAISSSMVGPIFCQRDTMARALAGVVTDCSSASCRNATWGPSRGSTDHSSRWQSPRARSASISPSSSPRVTRSAGDRGRSSIAVTRPTQLVAGAPSRACGRRASGRACDRRSADPDLGRLDRVILHPLFPVFGRHRGDRGIDLHGRRGRARHRGRRRWYGDRWPGAWDRAPVLHPASAPNASVAAITPAATRPGRARAAGPGATG